MPRSTLRFCLIFTSYGFFSIFLRDDVAIVMPVCFGSFINFLFLPNSFSMLFIQLAHAQQVDFKVDYIQELIALLKRAYNNLSIVGLYSTCDVSNEISIFYEFLSAETGSDDLILLTVDTELTDNRLDIAAYCPPTVVEFKNAVESKNGIEFKDVVIHTRYERIPVEIYATEADKIARKFSASIASRLRPQPLILSFFSTSRLLLDKYYNFHLLCPQLCPYSPQLLAALTAKTFSVLLPFKRISLPLTRPLKSLPLILRARLKSSTLLLRCVVKSYFICHNYTYARFCLRGSFAFLSLTFFTPII